MKKELFPASVSSDRRDFLKTAGLLAGGAMTGAFSALSFDRRLKAIGLQLFSIPRLLSEDFPAALRAIAEAGYKELEFFGPYPFSPEASIEGWKPLATQMGIKQNAYYGLEPKAARALMDDLGLSSPSMHADIRTLRERLEPAAEAAHIIGQRYVILPSMSWETSLTLDTFRRVAEEFNEIGERAKALGIRFAYHNHGNEHALRDDRVPFEVLLEETDPDLVDFEMDIFWMIAGGGDPVDFLQRYPGRFKLMHLKDMIEVTRFSGDGSTPMEWMALFPKMADPGAGVLDLDAITRQALASGVEHFFVERDLAPNPAETLANSYRYLAGL
jgi:sugar phosphate isomerase/epimerase